MTQQTLLDSISSPADLRRLDVHQLPQLAQELRAFMVESVSKTGGHLSSSLGATELAIAIHTAFNTPEDRVIWDVGHQAYAHKILTGRREGMLMGGACNAVLEVLADNGVVRPVMRFGLPDEFIEQGTQAELLEDVGLTSEALASKVAERIAKLGI